MKALNLAIFASHSKIGKFNNSICQKMTKIIKQIRSFFFSIDLKMALKNLWKTISVERFQQPFESRLKELQYDISYNPFL